MKRFGNDCCSATATLQPRPPKAAGARLQNRNTTIQVSVGTHASRYTGLV